MVVVMVGTAVAPVAVSMASDGLQFNICVLVVVAALLELFAEPRRLGDLDEDEDARKEKGKAWVKNALLLFKREEKPPAFGQLLAAKNSLEVACVEN